MRKPEYVFLNVTNLTVTTVTLTRHFQSKLTRKINQHLPVCSKNFPSLFVVCFFSSNTVWVIICLFCLNAEWNPICHLLALLGARHILHVSRIRVKWFAYDITLFAPIGWRQWEINVLFAFHQPIFRVWNERDDELGHAGRTDLEDMYMKFYSKNRKGRLYYIDKPVCVSIRETWIAKLKAWWYGLKLSGSRQYRGSGTFLTKMNYPVWYKANN